MNCHPIQQNRPKEETMSFIVKSVRLTFLALVAFLTLAAPSHAQAPSAQIRIDYVSGGFIIGGAGGNGVLTYKGKQYPLGVGGLSIGLTIGLVRARFRGDVYNLRNLADIEGTYTASDAGYALIRGRKASTLRNSRGVVLVLYGRQVGVEATLDVSGVQINLK
jgi:hypothetical protein